MTSHLLGLTAATAPQCWVLGLSFVPDLEIEAAVRLPAGVTHACDDLASLNPVSYGFVETLVVSIDAHVPVPVVDDDQEA